MMNHVGGGGRKRLVLVVVVMLHGTVEAYKSLDLCSEARFHCFWRGERQIGWMLPCELIAGPGLPFHYAQPRQKPRYRLSHE